MFTKDLKSVAREEMDNFVYYTNGLFDQMAEKLCGVIFILFGFHVAGIHGDVMILSLLIKIMVADFFLGVVCAIKNKKWNGHMLIRGICKFPLYALYIFLVACVDQLIFKSTGIDDGWCVRLFLSYLMVCEIYSVIRTLRLMGVKVPPLLQYLFTRLKVMTEYRGKKSIDKVIGKEGNNEYQNSVGDNPNHHSEPSDNSMVWIPEQRHGTGSPEGTDGTGVEGKPVPPGRGRDE